MINSPAFAYLPHLAGGHLPPLELATSAHYQPYVTAGAAAACDFLANITCVRLQSHMAKAFLAVSALLENDVTSFGMMPGASSHHCADAYLAGYLGRLQQELTLLRPNALSGCESSKG